MCYQSSHLLLVQADIPTGDRPLAPPAELHKGSSGKRRRSHVQGKTEEAAGSHTAPSRVLARKNPLDLGIS